jgi:hypothetical protein
MYRMTGINRKATKLTKSNEENYKVLANFIF